MRCTMASPPAKSIALTRYPQPTAAADKNAMEQMQLLQSLIVEVRALRKEIGVEEKASVPIEVRADAELRAIAEENHDIIEKLARVSEVRFVNAITTGLSRHHAAAFDVAVVL